MDQIRQDIDRPVDNPLNHSISIAVNEELIDQFIDAPELIHSLKNIATVLRPYMTSNFIPIVLCNMTRPL